MKVILKEDIPKLGRMGDTVEVAAGYGRNYLIPQGKAVLATSRNLKSLEHEHRLIQRRAELLREDAEGLAEKVSGLTLKLTRKVVEEDKLYGSVSVSDISQALEEAGITVERKQIKLTEPIKILGDHQDIELLIELADSGIPHYTRFESDHLRQLLRRRQDRLRDEAALKAGPYLAEKPRAFTARVRDAWLRASDEV